MTEEDYWMKLKMHSFTFLLLNTLSERAHHKFAVRGWELVARRALALNWGCQCLSLKEISFFKDIL